MKNGIVITVICIVLMLFSAGAYAEIVNEPKLSIKTDTLTIDGNIKSRKEGRFVSILVTNPGITIENYQNSKTEFQHKMTTVTEEDGYFCFNIKINSENITTDGVMSIYIGGDEFNENVVKNIYYAPADMRNEAIADLNLSVTGEKLSKYKDILSYDSELFDAVEKTKLAELIEKRNVEFTIDNVGEIITENALLEAFNQGLKELCIKDTGFSFNDIIEIEKIDEQYSCSVYKMYNEYINVEGKTKILEKMFNHNYTTLDDLKKQFIKNTLAFGVSNAEKSGYSHVFGLLTKENANAADINFDSFNNLNATQKAEAAIIIMNKDYYDEKELKKAVEDAVSAVTEKKSNSSGSGDGGSSGGGGSISIPPVTVDKNEAVKEMYAFDDIENVAWAKDAILNLYEKNIISGIGNMKFAPNNYVTREQMAKIITIAFELTTDDNENEGFSDVLDDAWYKSYVETVNRNKIMIGKDNLIFGVGENITRQDLAAVIARALKVDETNEIGEFIDFDEIPEYAKSAVVKLSELRIITGFGDGSFKGGAYCTRAQAAVIIDRALKVR